MKKQLKIAGFLTLMLVLIAGAFAPAGPYSFLAA
jgi:hypothetical protein